LSRSLNHSRHEFLRKKPAYLVLEKLISREWNTCISTITGPDGTFSFRGFKGTYEIEAEGIGKIRTVLNGNTAAPVILRKQNVSA